MFPRDKYSNISRFSPILGIGFHGLTFISFELIGVNQQNDKERNLRIQFRDFLCPVSTFDLAIMFGNPAMIIKNL